MGDDGAASGEGAGCQASAPEALVHGRGVVLACPVADVAAVRPANADGAFP